MDSEEDLPLIKLKSMKIIREPRIILHKLSKKKFELLKTGNRISLSKCQSFNETDGFYGEINDNDPIIDFDLQTEKNDAADDAKETIKDAVQPKSSFLARNLLHDAPDLPKPSNKIKKPNCQCNMSQEFVQCFPADINQKELKIEVVVPSNFLRKKQRHRLGKIVINLNNIQNAKEKVKHQNDQIVVDYQDPETSEVINIFTMKNEDLISKSKKVKPKPYKQLNIVKAKPHIKSTKPHIKAIKRQPKKPSKSPSLDSPTQNVVSSTTCPNTIVGSQTIFDQIGYDGPNGFISMSEGNHFNVSVYFLII